MIKHICWLLLTDETRGSFRGLCRLQNQGWEGGAAHAVVQTGTKSIVYVQNYM